MTTDNEYVVIKLDYRERHIKAANVSINDNHDLVFVDELGYIIYALSNGEWRWVEKERTDDDVPIG